MAQLFKRVCSVIVDGLKVEGLRVQFSVKKTLTKNPNTLDLKITNLSERTRGAMAKAKAAVILTAGYPGNAAVIFQGDARTIDHLRDGAEWITHIQCGDGERAYQFARFAESFAPGTAIADVIRACARALGINTGNLDEVLGAGGFRGNLTQFAHGYTAHGKASAELDKLLKTAGLSWSIQNGALQLLKGDAPAKGQAVLLSPTTGLIGSPDHGTPDKKGKPSKLIVKSLLQPQIVCGGRIEVQSAAVKGQFRVEALEHSGDSTEGDWLTKIEAQTA
jgi:hypothetical protein